MKTLTLSVADVAKYARVQGRKRQDSAHVFRIRAALRAGKSIEPPDVFEAPDGTRYVAEGNHRLDAFIAEGVETLRVRLHQGTRLDAIRYGAKVNGDNPDDIRLPLRTSERKEYARQILAEAAAVRVELSSRQVARDCGLDHKTVEKMRPISVGDIPQLKRIGADGKSYKARKQPAKRATPKSSPVAALAAKIDAAPDAGSLGAAWGDVGRAGLRDADDVAALEARYVARKRALETVPAALVATAPAPHATEFDHSDQGVAPPRAASPVVLVASVAEADADGPEDESDEPLPPTVFKTWDWPTGRRDMDEVLFDLMRRAPHADLEDLVRWLDGWLETAKEKLNDHRRAM